MELNILIGGEAGQGLKTIDTILGKTLFRMGFDVYATRDYMSRIRGGHNFIKIRVGTDQVLGPADKLDVLLALNEETIERHKEDLKEDGIIIFDGELETDTKLISLPAGELAKDVNKKALNTVFIGALLKTLNLKLAKVKEIISDYFTEEKIRKDNLFLLKKGYDQVDNVFNLSEKNVDQDTLFIDGNSAVGLGALAAGVQFYVAYPMSPSTGIMNYIAGKQDDTGVVVEQAEDEIGAINMALGASYGGIRAMTGTSGGGLALMAEAVGLAGITETPLVIADVQRPGPATGLPTRTEQGDLLFSINIAQGEFPIMVISPRDQEDAFYQTFRAVNLADKYQLPVIILSDQFLADSTRNIPKFDLDSLEYKTSLISDDSVGDVEEYKRYLITDDGISPRAYPGQIKGEVVLADSDEHDETGHIIEDANLRQQMVDKRMRKFNNLKENELIQPTYTGEEEIDYLLIGWGSTYGPIMEAKQLLQADDIKVGYLSYSDVWPLPVKKLKQLISNDTKTVVIENNSTGQFSHLVRAEAGIKIDHQVLKYTGRPFTGEEIYHRIQEEVIK